MLEIWKDIKGFPNYRVSNQGQVKSLDRTKWNGKGQQNILGLILKPLPNGRGYLQVSLSKDGIVTTRTIHRLVLQAFVTNIHNKRTINHKNGIKTDNRLVNLEWATDLENSQHAWDNGYFKNEKAINQIKDGVIVNTFKSMSEAHRKTKVQLSNISCCCSGVRPNAGGYQWEYKKMEVMK